MLRSDQDLFLFCNCAVSSCERTKAIAGSNPVRDVESRGRDDHPKRVATHRRHAVNLARHAVFVGAGVRISSWRNFIANAQEHFQGARQKVSRNIYSLARHSLSLCPACATDSLGGQMIQVVRIFSGRPYGPCSDRKQTALQVAGSEGTRKSQENEVCSLFAHKIFLCRALFAYSVTIGQARVVILTTPRSHIDNTARTTGRIPGLCVRGFRATATCA